MITAQLQHGEAREPGLIPESSAAPLFNASTRVLGQTGGPPQVDRAGRMRQEGGPYFETCTVETVF